MRRTEKRGRWGMGWGRGWSALFVLPLALAACSDSRPDQFPTPSGGDSGLPPRTVLDLGVPDRGTTSDDAEDGGIDARDGGTDAQPVKVTVAIETPLADKDIPAKALFMPAVLVTVTSPMPAAEDAVGEVVATLIRRATKTRVAFGKLNQTGLEILPESGSIAYRFSDTAVDVSKAESAEYDLLVTAQTMGGAKAEATIRIRLDAGPTIQILDPTDGKSEQLSTKVRIKIKDDLVALKTTTFHVGQWPLTALMRTGDEWTGVIEFAKFDPPLDGEQLITVRATNTNDVETMAVRRFIVDKRGPTIANTSPKVGALIGKIITIQADVSDPAGVVDSSVVAVVAHGDNNFEVKLDPPPAGAMPPTYKKLFDTTRLPVNALFPSISFRARDVHGNESSIGYLVSLDNTPPLADLDPPADFRTLTKLGETWSCSWPFDPVGPDAVDDGDLVPQLFDIRARIEDQGNESLSGVPDYTPIAGVDDNRAQLLILDDIRQPLIVDTNNDGVCDDVNPNLTPTTAPKSSQDALLMNMVAIPPAGVGDGTLEPGMACSGSVAVRPEAPCATTFNASKTRWPREPTFMNLLVPWIPHSEVLPAYIPYTTGRMAAIWTVPPVVDDKIQCAGRQFDAFANNIADGWACVAVAAADKLGNLQVSRAMRLCIDRDGNGEPCPHRNIAKVSFTSPMIVETKTPHGLMELEETIVSGVVTQTAANGRWKVNVIDATHFSLVGALPYVPHFCISAPNQVTCDPTTTAGVKNRIKSFSAALGGVVVETDSPHGLDPAAMIRTLALTGVVDEPWLNGTHEYDVVDSTRFLLKAAALLTPASGGRVVAVRELPDCTGTMTAKAEGTTPAVVTNTKSCRPWTAFTASESRKL